MKNRKKYTEKRHNELIIVVVVVVVAVEVSSSSRQFSGSKLQFELISVALRLIKLLEILTTLN